MSENFRNIDRNGCGCGENERHGRDIHPGRAELLNKIRQFDFMMVEAGLFLNNQCDCEAAQEDFCTYRRHHAEAVAEYEACYGPLTYDGIDVKRDGWSWIQGPWPWEVEDC